MTQDPVRLFEAAAIKPRPAEDEPLDGWRLESHSPTETKAKQKQGYWNEPTEQRMGGLLQSAHRLNSE